MVKIINNKKEGMMDQEDGERKKAGPADKAGKPAEFIERAPEVFFCF